MTYYPQVRTPLESTPYARVRFALTTSRAAEPWRVTPEVHYDPGQKRGTHAGDRRRHDTGASESQNEKRSHKARGEADQRPINGSATPWKSRQPQWEPHNAPATRGILTLVRVTKAEHGWQVSWRCTGTECGGKGFGTMALGDWCRKIAAGRRVRTRVACELCGNAARGHAPHGKLRGEGCSTELRARKVAA
jgi:hypothetical protein